MHFHIQGSEESQLQERGGNHRVSTAKWNWFGVLHDFALSGPTLLEVGVDNPLLLSGSCGQSDCVERKKLCVSQAAERALLKEA